MKRRFQVKADERTCDARQPLMKAAGKRRKEKEREGKRRKEKERERKEKEGETDRKRGGKREEN